MDDQQNKDPEEPNEQPLDAAAATPEPGLQPAEGTPDETPDAIKAAGDQPIGGEFAGGDAATVGEDDSGIIDPSTINDPSMNLPEMDAVAEEPTPLPSDVQAHPAEFPQFGNATAAKIPRNIDLLMDVKLPVSIELGRTALPIGEILEWGQGSIIELDRLAGEPVDLMVNNKLVAKGEVVVVDEKFGLRITSLMSPRERLETL